MFLDLTIGYDIVPWVECESIVTFFLLDFQQVETGNQHRRTKLLAVDMFADRTFQLSLIIYVLAAPIEIRLLVLDTN